MEAQLSSARSATSAVAVGRIVRRPAITGRRGHGRFYLAVTLILFAIVLRGFWPTYFGPLLRGGLVRPWIIHLHGAVFVGWMVLLLAQVTLVATGRVRAHRRVGNAGLAYGALVLGLGLVVSFTAPVLHIRAGEWTVDEAAARASGLLRERGHHDGGLRPAPLHGDGGVAEDRALAAGSLRRDVVSCRAAGHLQAPGSR
jgi:hypothetical protein